MDKIITNYFIKQSCREVKSLKPYIKETSNCSIQELLLAPRSLGDEGIIPRGILSPYMVKKEKSLYLLASTPATTKGVVMNDEYRRIKYVIDDLKIEQKLEKVKLTDDLMKDFSVMKAMAMLKAKSMKYY